MIRIKAPNGKKLYDTKTGRLYSEVVCEDKYADRYVIADSDEAPTVIEKDGVTLADRVADLEDAVIELAEIITEG